MNWLRTHGLEYGIGTTTHTLWFSPISHTSVTGSDFTISFNLTTRPA